MLNEQGVDNPSFDPGSDVTDNKVGKTTNAAEEHERPQWGNSLEFMMSCIATSVGLGNIWRFPFIAYKNGGGAFLIPYVIVWLLVGRPLYYMEMALGQFSSRGNIRVFESLAPYLKGVGYAQLTAVFFVSSYYSSLIAIALLYLVYSFTANLPWGECLDNWAPYLNKTNQVCVSATQTNWTHNNTISSSDLFFSQEVLKETTDISDGLGLPDWRMTLALLFTWVVTFLISVKGVRSSGKASYFLALFPYVIMTALLIRAVTLEGAITGMYYFIKPDMNKLLEAQVWYDAVSQCFFSLNVGFGAIAMFASYNDFNHNINRDALIVTTLDTCTSVLAGVTIFGILGNLAHNLGVSVDEVIKSGGTGLAFISYPDAIAKMEAVPALFAVLFFFMLFVLGNGSLVALHGTMNTVVKDHFPNIAIWKVAASTAIITFLIGLMYVTPGGQFMLNLVDQYGVTFVLYTFIIVQVSGVSWFYGVENFCLDIEFMLKNKVNIYWKLTWGFVTPFVLIAIYVYFCATNERLTYNSSPYPDGVLIFGWAIFAFTVIQFIFWIGYNFYKYRKLSWSEMVSAIFSNNKWRPYDDSHYEEWKKFKTENLGVRKSLFRKCLSSVKNTSYSFR